MHNPIQGRAQPRLRVKKRMVTGSGTPLSELPVL